MTCRARLRTRAADESGAAGFGLLWLSLCIIFSGLAVDVSNGYRYKTQLRAIADAAAHSGVITLVGGGTEDEIRAAVLAEVELNMPAAQHGALVRDPATDIKLLRYDVDTRTLHTDGEPDTVQVHLQRTRAFGNPLPTLFLHVADVFDRDDHDYSSWDVTATGIAALAETEQCRSYNYFYAGGSIDLTSQNTFGARFCVHSQGEVWMSQQNTFEANSGISMPNLDACKTKCSDDANPGAADAAFATNLLVEPVSDVIARIQNDFLTQTGEHADFFANRTLDSDLSALGTLVGNTMPTKGSVIEMSRLDFQSLTDIPEGLTYKVTCVSGNKPLKIAQPPSGGTIRNIALITNCALDFDGSAHIESSLILSTRVTANASVTAASGARVGTQTAECQPEKRTYIYSAGSMQVPADFMGSNVSVSVKEGIKMAATSSSTNLTHVGLTMITEGDLSVASSHTMKSCATPPDGKTPRLRLIRHLEMSPIL